MSDRTQLAFGRNSISVPKFTKRIVEVAVATGLTGLASLIILSLNNILVTTSGFMRGFEIWKSFIGRSDILGTMILPRWSPSPISPGSAITGRSAKPFRSDFIPVLNWQLLRP